MQLILDSEATIDIKEKMTTLENVPVKDLKSPEIIKKDVVNGNQENIVSKDNLIKNSENIINGIDKDFELTEDTIFESEIEKENTVVNKNEQKVEEKTREDEIKSIDNVIESIEDLETSHSNKDDKIDIELAETVGIKSDNCSYILSSNEHMDNSNVDKDISNGISECETIELQVSGCESTGIQETGCKTSELKDNNETGNSESKQNNLTESEKAAHVENVLNKSVNEMVVEEQIEKIFDQVESIDQCSTPDETSSTNHLDDNKLNLDPSKLNLTGQEVLDPESENGSIIANAPTKLNNILDTIKSDEIKDTFCGNNSECGKSENVDTVVERKKDREGKYMNCEDCDTAKDINNIEGNKDISGENNLECNKSENMETDLHKTKEMVENNMECEDCDESKDINNSKEIVTKNNAEEKLLQEVVSAKCGEDSKNNCDNNLESFKSDSIDKSEDILSIGEIEVPEKKQFNKTESKTSPDENVSVCDNSENISKTAAIVLSQKVVQADGIELESSKNNIIEKMDCDESENNVEADKILDVDEVKETDKCEIVEKCKENILLPQEKNLEPEKKICKLSNTLDILSDDEDTVTDEEPKVSTTEKQCINIEDDDDIMLIDEDLTSKESKQEPKQKVEELSVENTVSLENSETHKSVDTLTEEKASSNAELETSNLNIDEEKDELKEDVKEEAVEKPCPLKPLLPENFLKSYKKNLTDMTRDELEEFCILKIVESIVDRSNLSDIKSKLKAMSQNIEEYKKKAMMLTKQNRDLQVVLKSIQEEQKKKADTAITPLKITRSVGMQVIMQEKMGLRKKPGGNVPTAPIMKNLRSANQNPKQQKTTGAMPPIPVPRLIPAHGQTAKPVNVAPATPNNNSQNKTPSPVPNGVRPPAQKSSEKRQHNRLQSVTVDLTDDEPPSKAARVVPAPPVRLVSPQSLLAPQRQPFGQNLSSPRKVYIPISGPQNQNIRPGQTIMLKSVPAPRQRCPTPQLTRMPQNSVRMTRVPSRHPAPLPDYLKQYQPPNWKALPPAPDLKLSKVENGIVISWKIDGYQEDSYEEIASYQLYAYQETASPPSTALWKKIGDVKALPLPMACTLTQFMAGFKYYFAVRAVDVRSRLGPFSLPGSILLLNKM